MKILDRNFYRSVVAKNNIRKLNIHLLEFDKTIEYQIVKELMKYTYNFIVLQTDSEEKITVRRYQKHMCSLENVSRVITNIFCNIICDEGDNSIDAVNNEYIIFSCSNNGGDEYVSYNDFNVKSFHFTYLTDCLKFFHLYDYYFYDSHAVVRLSDVDKSDEIEIIENDRPQDNPKIVLSPMVGIGDYFMMFSLLYEYIIRERKKGIEVYFAVVDKNSSILALLSTVFPENKRVLFDNGAMYNYCLSADNKDVISLSKMHIHECQAGKYNINGYHLTDTIKGMLGIEADFYIYTHNKYILKCISKALSKKEKRDIEFFFEGKDYVALQYFTGSYDEVNDIWVTNPDRNWDEENVRKFVELCDQENIRLIKFSGQPDYNINIQQFKTKSVLHYIYSLSRVKVLVGIDSSGGHIASCYNIPSITIWGHQTPKFYQIVDTHMIKQTVVDDIKISLRPIRKNVSIYSNERCSKMVYADVVFEQLVDILNRKIEFGENNLGYDDNKNCICL